VTVIFHIPGPLRQFVGGNSQVDIQVQGQTVRDALIALWIIYPGIRDRLVTEQGQIREHINVFVGNENIRQTGGLVTPIFAGAEISIVPAISGGATEITLQQTHLRWTNC
jgi:molybdopterin converting factor small subunit